MVCSNGFPPKLLPEETCRWIACGFSPAVTTLIARADGSAVGLLADQLDGQPVIALAGVLEEDVVVLIAINSAAGFNEEIDVAVAVPVAAGHPWPF